MLRRSPLSTLFPYTTLFRSLNAVAERIGWSKPAPSGVHRGLAHLHCFDSFVAAACEISVKDGNKVKVHRIVAATDPRSEERRVGKECRSWGWPSSAREKGTG